MFFRALIRRSLAVGPGLTTGARWYATCFSSRRKKSLRRAVAAPGSDRGPPGGWEVGLALYFLCLTLVESRGGGCYDADDFQGAS